MSLTKLSLGGIIQLFPDRESLVIVTKEFIIKMEGNTGEFSDISGSEIHEGRSVQSIR
jgi:hypothetical protein